MTDANKRTGKRDIEVIFKNCAPFIEWTSEIDNTQTGDAKDLDIMMSVYNLIEHSDNHSKTSGSL